MPVTYNNLLADNERLRNETGYLQAKIDSLMLEYCPEDMTKEQVAEWERNQRPSEVQL